jgi:6-phosphofructokinase 1
MLFFDPANLACGIVTCGGLCPGLNDVIRAIAISLRRHYGVNKVYGFRYGYEGLVRRIGHEPLELTPESVHRNPRERRIGSRFVPRAQDAAEMVDYLNDLGVGILFAIGGDGTLRGAQKIGEEAARRGLKIGVIGIPKTIDNDVSFVQRTFGFETAVTEARRATSAANAEAEAARNGIGS